MDQKDINHLLHEKAVASEQFKSAFKAVAIPLVLCILVGIPWIVGVTTILSQ